MSASSSIPAPPSEKSRPICSYHAWRSVSMSHARRIWRSSDQSSPIAAWIPHKSANVACCTEDTTALCESPRPHRHPPACPRRPRCAGARRLVTRRHSAFLSHEPGVGLNRGVASDDPKAAGPVPGLHPGRRRANLDAAADPSSGHLLRRPVVPLTSSDPGATLHYDDRLYLESQWGPFRARQTVDATASGVRRHDRSERRIQPAARQ